MAFGVLRIAPAVFWYRMSLRDWILTQRGFLNNENRIMQEAWERARVISFWSVRGMVKISMKEVMHFPWDDKEIEQAPYTAEEMRHILLKYGMNTDGDKFYN
jgi:hypothetical protein